MTNLRGNPLAEETIDKALDQARGFIEDKKSYEPYGGVEFVSSLQGLLAAKAISKYPEVAGVRAIALQAIIASSMTIGLILERRRIEGENLEKSFGELVG